MEGNDQEFHFACTHCGECCNIGKNEVQLTQVEAISLGLKLPLLTAIRVYPFDENLFLHIAGNWIREGMSGEIRAITAKVKQRFIDSHYIMNFNIRGKTARFMIGASVFIVPDLTGYCPQWRGGRCAIYAERPFVCRAFPYPTDSIPERANLDAQRMVKDGFKCDTTNEAPLFIRADGSLVDTEADIQRLANHYIEDQKNLAQKIIEMKILADPCSLLENAGPSKASYISMVPILFASISDGLMSRKNAIEVAEFQIKILQNRVDDAVKQKISTEKQRTAIHRGAIASYRKYIADEYKTLVS